MTHPLHLANRDAYAERMANFLYANEQGSDWLAQVIEVKWYWRQVCLKAKESHFPTVKTRQLVIEKLKVLEASGAPRDESLKVSEEVPTSPAAIPGPDPQGGASSGMSEAPQSGKPAGDVAAPQASKGSADTAATPSASASVDAPARVAPRVGPGGQASLMDLPKTPYRKSSRTSLIAARAMQKGEARTKLQQVYRFILDNPNVADEDIVAGTGIIESTVRPRRVDLADAGLIVCTGTKTGRSGIPVQTWAVAEAVSA